MAAAKGLPIAALIREIDEGRGAPNLSSSVRVAVLAWYRDKT